MKILMKSIGIFLIIGMLTSCVAPSHHGRKPMPPGHAKKVYGGNAKYYAPGQVKKRGHHHGRH